MDENKHHILRSIWFWWFLTTIIYLLFNFAGYPSLTTPSTIGYIAGFVGLFVPYGFLSAILFVSSSYYSYAAMSWFSLVVFLAMMIFIEWNLKKHNFSLTKKILLNLLVLLILTTLVDFIRQTPFESWAIFLNGSVPGVNSRNF